MTTPRALELGRHSPCRRSRFRPLFEPRACRLFRGRAPGSGVRWNPVAQCIRRRLNLGAQPAAAVSDGLRRPPFCPSTVLGRSHDGRADHRVLVAGLLRQGFKDLLPYTAVVPATVVQVRHLEVSETCRQIAPRDAGPVAARHRQTSGCPVLLAGRHARAANP